jgi:hypothetical protein
LAPQTPQAPQAIQNSREDFCDYVADLQLHMSLQARNLVPPLSQIKSDTRTQSLHKTLATIEKQVSRQRFSKP